MLEIFDKSRKRIAIAENASGVEEERKINSLWYLTFSLPYNDAKNEYCQPFNYIRYNGGELYRIMPVDAEITEDRSFDLSMRARSRDLDRQRALRVSRRRQPRDLHG